MSSDRKDITFLRIAYELGKLGTCDRGRVGALITHNGRAVSWGYNGAPPGLLHCDENDHGHYGAVAFLEVEGCVNATHAEANALAFAARQGISTEGATLYVTMSPCAVCARLVIASGIQRVVTNYIYRDPEGWNLLDRAGIERSFLGVRK